MSRRLRQPGPLNVPGGVCTLVEHGTSDFLGTANAYALRDIPLSGSYDPARFFPVIFMGGDIYPTDGDTGYSGRIKKFYEDFAAGVIRLQIWANSATKYFRAHYGIYKIPEGAKLHQEVYSVPVPATIATPAETTFTLTETLRTDSPLVIQPFRSNNVPATDTAYGAWGMGVSVQDSQTGAFVTNYVMGGASVVYEVPVIAIH